MVITTLHILGDPCSSSRSWILTLEGLVHRRTSCSHIPHKKLKLWFHIEGALQLPHLSMGQAKLLGAHAGVGPG